MNKQEYMNELNEKLAGFDEEIRKEIESDYEEHFRMGQLNGKSEDQICAELGNIDELVDELNKLTGKETRKGIHIDEDQIRQAADNLANEMNDAMKNLAGFLGRLSASVSRGTGKFTSNVGETASRFVDKAGEKAGDFAGKVGEKAGEFAGCFTEKAGDFTDKAEEYAQAFKKGFEAAADKIASGSKAFAKEVAENYRRSMNREAGEAAAEAGNEPDGAAEEDGSDIDLFFGVGNSNEGEAAGEVNYVCEEECDSVVIETDCGDVTLEPSEDSKVHFNYENNGSMNQQLAYKFNFRQEGRTVFVSAKKQSGSSNFFRSISCPDITVTASLPEGLKNVSVHAMSGDIKAEEVKADQITLSTKSGDVELDSIHARSAEVQTLSGDINASDISVDHFIANTKSGDIEMDNCLTKSLEIFTVSGDLRLDDISAAGAMISGVSGDIDSDDCVIQDFTVKTVSGDVDFSDLKTGSLTAETVSGDIEIALTEADGYLANVKTTSGDVSLDYNDETVQIIRSGSYVLGNGAVKLNISSLSGDISVEG